MLLLFSGHTSDESSLAARLEALGVHVTAYDQKIGGRKHDLTSDTIINNLIQRTRVKEFDYIFASSPCKSFSIAPADSRPQLRSKEHPQRLPTVPPEWRQYLERHNKMAATTTAMIRAAHDSGVPWAVENPADRGDSGSPAFWKAYAHHGTLWDYLRQHDIGNKLHNIIQAHEHTLPMCSFGASHQKYTTIWFSTNPSSTRDILHDECPHTHKCTHKQHCTRLRGYHADGHPKTHGAEKYPPKMAAMLAIIIARTILQKPDVEGNTTAEERHLAYLAKMARNKSRTPRSKPCLVDDIFRYISVPTSYREVLQHEFRDQIIDSMVLEFEAHLRNKTWTRLVPRTPDMNVVGSTWAWDIKRDG